MPDNAGTAMIALPFFEYDDIGERTAAVTVTITLAELAKRIGQSADKEAVAAFADGIRNHPSLWPASTGILDRVLTLTLAEGDPALTIEGPVDRLVSRIADVVARHLGASARADLASLIDAQAHSATR